jgi:hypothetical protein
MPRVTAFPATNSEGRNHAIVRANWFEWAPIVVLPAGVCIFRSSLLPWQSMWLVSFAIFWGCKWLTWFRARAARTRATLWRNLGYLLLWLGMDASIAHVST